MTVKYGCISSGRDPRSVRSGGGLVAVVADPQRLYNRSNGDSAIRCVGSTCWLERSAETLGVVDLDCFFQLLLRWALLEPSNQAKCA